MRKEEEKNEGCFFLEFLSLHLSTAVACFICLLSTTIIHCLIIVIFNNEDWVRQQRFVVEIHQEKSKYYHCQKSLVIGKLTTAPQHVNKVVRS
jgi:hypothetical protein